MFNGIKVVESVMATEPVIRLSKDVMVTDAFREKCNKFYLDMFGTKPAAYMMSKNALGMNEPTLLAHPEIIVALKAKLGGVSST